MDRNPVSKGSGLPDLAGSTVSCSRPCDGHPLSAQNRSVTPNSPPKNAPGQDGPDAIAEAAAAWVIRRHGSGWSAQDEAELTRWRTADAVHEAEFSHIERVWGQTAGLADAPDLVASLRPVPPGRAAAWRGARAASMGLAGRWRHVAGGAGLALMAMVAVVVSTGGEPMLALQADQRTAVGEVREVVLPDGSTARLAASSAMAVKYSDTERRVTLLRGQALFEAKPATADAGHRPFVVDAAAGSTRALGTRFIVERLATHTRVVGIEHRVAVSIGSARRPGATLGPGQSVRYDEAGISAVGETSPQVLDAEARGQLVFERAHLVDVVERLNRHYAGHISVRGEALAQRQVSGVFPADDVQGALSVLQAELKLGVLRLPGFVILY